MAQGQTSQKAVENEVTGLFAVRCLREFFGVADLKKLLRSGWNSFLKPFYGVEEFPSGVEARSVCVPNAALKPALHGTAVVRFVSRLFAAPEGE
jgi:hypothetical protein